MKKFASFILAAALGMALLTGCGFEKPAETSAAGSAESQTSAASSDAEASVPEKMCIRDRVERPLIVTDQWMYHSRLYAAASFVKTRDNRCV